MPSPEIVIIEDNQDCLFLLEEFMNIFGYTTQSFTNAESVLPFCRGKLFQPKLFLIDISLPGMSGTEFLNSIQPLSHLNESKKIAATVMSHPDELTVLKNKGFDDVFTKPIDFSLLEQKLESHLKQRVIS